ncbi:MAG: sulfotransferase [Chloroflexi bacterium]|nr:sulfotransferase [Chloroflexota bacterium]
MRERIPEERRQLVRDLYHDSISYHTAATLKWVLRNEFYFDYHLQDQPERVRLVRYEDLVAAPESQMRALFAFLGIHFDPKFVAHMRTSSVRKADFPTIDAAVQALGDAMLARLDAAVATQPATTEGV